MQMIPSQKKLQKKKNKSVINLEPENARFKKNTRKKNYLNYFTRSLSGCGEFDGLFDVAVDAARVERRLERRLTRRHDQSEQLGQGCGRSVDVFVEFNGSERRAQQT